MKIIADGAPEGAEKCSTVAEINALYEALASSTIFNKS